MKKTIAFGVGFLVTGLVVKKMFDMFGIELDTWVLCLIFGIGIALIVYGAIPSKVRDWTKEQVQLILPDRVVTPKQLERELKWYKIRSIILKITSKFRR